MSAPLTLTKTPLTPTLASQHLAKRVPFTHTVPRHRTFVLGDTVLPATPNVPHTLGTITAVPKTSDPTPVFLVNIPGRGTYRVAPGALHLITPAPNAH